MNEFFERLFGVKNNNIRPTRNQLRVPRNNIRLGPVSPEGQNKLVESWMDFVNQLRNQRFTKQFRKGSARLAGKSGSGVGRAALLMPYIEAIQHAQETGKHAAKTRKENREQLFKNINKPLPPVQMPNARPFSPEMYAP